MRLLYSEWLHHLCSLWCLVFCAFQHSVFGTHLKTHHRNNHMYCITFSICFHSSSRHLEQIYPSHKACWITRISMAHLFLFPTYLKSQSLDIIFWEVIANLGTVLFPISKYWQCISFNAMWWAHNSICILLQNNMNPIYVSIHIKIAFADCHMCTYSLIYSHHLVRTASNFLFIQKSAVYRGEKPFECLIAN